LDVSRAPIREAIKMLVERGLLVQVPRRGVFVREYSIREIQEINELRLAIEVGALSRAMTGGYLLQLDLLYDALDAPAPVVEGGDTSGLQREFAIHRAIVQLYPNEHFIHAFDGVTNALRVAIAGVRLKDVSEAQLRQDYGPLVRTIRTHDHDRAIGLLREAVNEFATRVLQGLGPPDTHSVEPSDRDRIAG
jgi:DNA-binding GntR family transcriptional regulator